MKKIVLIIFMFLLNTTNVLAKEEVEFSSCIDGDTIKVVVDGEIKTVRMLAIDTPESVHPTIEVEYYGKEASDYTCDKITNAKKLELEYDDNSDKIDKYDRLLAWVFVDDYLLQDLLVTNGYAEVAYLYDDYKYTTLLEDHQTQAELKKIGIWDEIAKEAYSPSEEETDDKNLTIKDIIVLVVIALIGYSLTYLKKKIKKSVKKYGK